MSEVMKRYFVGEGERAVKVATDGLAKANEIHHKRSAYLTEVGADGFWEFRHRAPYGFVLYREEDRLPGFLMPDAEFDHGKRCWIHRPDKRTTIGKKVLARFQGLATFNFSEFACKEFGVAHSVIGNHAASRSRLAMYSSAAGYMQKTLVFCIPFGGDEKDSDPAIPADLREIKKSEYIALTEEGTS